MIYLWKKRKKKKESKIHGTNPSGFHSLSCSWAVCKLYVCSTNWLHNTIIIIIRYIQCVQLYMYNIFDDLQAKPVSTVDWVFSGKLCEKRQSLPHMIAMWQMEISNIICTSVCVFILQRQHSIELWLSCEFADYMRFVRKS